MTSAYATLETRFRRLGLVNEAVAMLHWDSAAMMPEGAAGARAEQLAELKVIAHEILADPRLDDLIHEAADDGLDDWQRANLAEMRRLWLHATAVPADLVAAYSRACSECEMAWRKARPADDFASVRSLLQRVLDLTREVAAAKAAKLGTSPYEALLDQFEPRGRVAEIDRLFDHLAARLPALIEGALAAQAARSPPLRPAGPFPIAAQRQAARRLMERLGFEFHHGRLDQSLHPFCGGTADDVRITTRYDEADFARALMG
ncbi:MAG: carboxypeptidase M32, partial [Stellaceae bacterium]